MRLNSDASRWRISLSSSRCLSHSLNVCVNRSTTEREWSWGVIEGAPASAGICALWTAPGPTIVALDQTCDAFRGGLWSAAKALCCPGMQASRNWELIAAALRRDVKAENFRGGDQCRKAAGFEEQLRLGMHRIEGLLRQRVAQFVCATGQRRQRRGTIHGDAVTGDPFKPAPFPKSKRAAMPQREPVRHQFILLHQGNERCDDRIAWGKIEHRVAKPVRPLPGEIRFCGIDFDRLEQQPVGVEHEGS